MTIIINAYQNALLADATYALKQDGLKDKTGEDLEDLLKERMTPTLAKYIGDNFTVVTHIESSDVIGSGFDATVWRNNATGKLTISMEGTKGLTDFLTDADLASPVGSARQQICDMVNWWTKITTPVGQNAQQLALV